MSERNLNSQKNAFICNFAVLGDVEEAAVKAGFPRETALQEGFKILKNASCRDFAAELRKSAADSGAVISGLRRLAFGNCRDAVVLAFAEELPPASVIESLDLFNVSEIKRDKGGGVEIKLFDRLKALEKLMELEMTCDSRDKANELIRALSPSEGGDDNGD